LGNENRAVVELLAP